jgi:hypothetical protein
MVFYWVVAMHNYVYMVQCQYHSDTLAKQISEADLQGVGLVRSYRNSWQLLVVILLLDVHLPIHDLNI